MQMQNFEKHVWAEIDLDALRANFRTVKQRADSLPLCTLIRPMLLATEHEVRCAVKEEDFPIVKSRCPADGVTVREQTKDFVRERCRTDHAFRQKTLHALQESGIDGWRPVHTGRTSNPSPKEGMHHADAEL